jgi:hypothetical protein
MARTVSDVPCGNFFPQKGKHNCIVIGFEKGKSKTKHTPQIELTLSNGETEFKDQLFVTEKTLNRLCLVAQRVCGMPKDTAIPDNNLEAANFVAAFICENVTGKKCVATIEENEETFMSTSGPNAGRNMTKKRRRVAFNGYDVPCETIDTEPEHTDNDNVEYESDELI